MAGDIIFLDFKVFIIEGFKISYSIGYSLLVSYICELAKISCFYYDVHIADYNEYSRDEYS